jgi:hypothetical protein
MVRRPPKLKAELTAVLFASVVLAALRRAAGLIVARLLERDAELRQLSAGARAGSQRGSRRVDAR